MPCFLKSTAAFSADSNPSPGKKRLTARWANRHLGTCVASHRFCALHKSSLRIKATR
jgi:hypothetical protein